MAPFITNTWIRYIDRTYQQIKTQVLTALQTRVPEITDHTEGNVFVKMIGIWGGIAEMLGYYIDNAARESFIVTCRLYASAVRIARGMDYRIRASFAATVDITFTIDVNAPSAVTIPLGTSVQTDDGVVFLTTAAATIAIGSNSVVVGARQAVAVTNTSLGVSDGSINQEFLITDKILDGSCVVRVNGLGWTQADTVGFSIPTSEVYVQTINEDGVAIIKFGNDINGKVPTAGDAIVADYYVTEGVNGNVGENTITNINGTITLPGGVSSISCTNVNRAAGGAEIESLEDLRRRVPLALRTLMRAVTRKDYPDYAELAPGVILAGLSYNCGKYVEVYIVPDGGGVASLSLIGTTQTWMDNGKMITTQVLVKPAGEVRLLFNINVKVKPEYPQVATLQRVTDNLVEFVSYKHQVIGGTVELGDVYEIVENTEGVEVSQVNLMTPTPYARLLDATVHILNWTPVIATTNTTTVQWTIRMTSPTTFQLLKASVFVGNFTVGVAVVQPEITFTVNAGTYSTNDDWEFYTYPYNGTLTLVEPSLPVSLAGDITLIGSGGI